jgi:plasmid stabilization system protein ParE
MVEWKKVALKQFNDNYNYIKSQSPFNAEKVKAEIVDYIEQLSLHPEIGLLDKYVENNDGTFRFFIKHSLRIHYRVTGKDISILRVWHTKRKEK